MPWRTGQTSSWPVGTGPHSALCSSSSCVNRSALPARRVHFDHSSSFRAVVSTNAAQLASHTSQLRPASTKLSAVSVAHSEAPVGVENAKCAPSHTPDEEILSGTRDSSPALPISTSDPVLNRLWLDKGQISTTRRCKSKSQLIHDVDKATKQLLGKRAKVWKQKALPKRISTSRLNKILSSDDTVKLVHKFHDLSKQGHLDSALLVAEKLSRACAVDVQKGVPNAWDRVIHKLFLREAQKQKAVDAALHFIHVLPDNYADNRTFSMLLSVCSAAANPTVALAVADLAQQQGVTLDVMHFTNLITACGQQGLAERALKLYNELKLHHRRSMDSYVYASLLTAFARCIEMQPAHDSKQRLVLLERAFGILDEAVQDKAQLSTPVFNALLNCAVHCDQAERAFKVLELMQFHACRPDSITYGSLIEVCVRTQQPKLGMRMFDKALQAGFDKEVQLYTLALRTCMVQPEVSATCLQRGLSIHRTAIGNGVQLDDLFWGQFLALLGRAKRVHLCLGMMKTYLKQLPAGRTPTAPVVSALMSCCMHNCNHYSAHLVYQLARSQGILPSVQQYNRLMHAYARERRLSAVVTLACDMLQAGVQPTPVTFAVLLGACEKTDQVELAFELVANMKQRGLSVEMMHLWILAKLCFNRIRYSWYPPMSHPGDRFQGPVRPSVMPGQAFPTVYIPVVRRNEAQHLLAALGCADCDTVGAATSAAFGTHRKARRTGLPGATAGPATPPSLDFLGAGSSSGHWSSRLLGVYREAVSSGLKPSLKLLDRILACLRLQFKGASGKPAGSLGACSGSAEHGFMSAVPFELARSLPFINVQPLGLTQSKYEVPFSTRAFAIVEEAIAQDFLPSFALDSPATLDLRRFGPTLAEVYVLYIFQMLERRASVSGRALNHPVALLTPCWDPNFVMWPHLVPRIKHHTDTVTTPASAALALEPPSAGGSRQLAATAATTPGSTAEVEAVSGSVVSIGQSPNVEKMMRGLMARNVPGCGLGPALLSQDWSGSFDEEVSSAQSHPVNGHAVTNENAMSGHSNGLAQNGTQEHATNGFANECVSHVSTSVFQNQEPSSSVPITHNGDSLMHHDCPSTADLASSTARSDTSTGTSHESPANPATGNHPPAHSPALHLHATSAPTLPDLSIPLPSLSAVTPSTSSTENNHTHSNPEGSQHTTTSSPNLPHTALHSSQPAVPSTSTVAQPNRSATALTHSTHTSTSAAATRTPVTTSTSTEATAAATTPTTTPTASHTGLAVAATLKRMKIRAVTDPGLGLIVIDPKEVNRWAHGKIKYDSQLKHQTQQAPPAFAQQLHHVIGPKPWLMEQQRNIRLGMEADAMVRPPRSL